MLRVPSSIEIYWKFLPNLLSKPTNFSLSSCRQGLFPNALTREELEFELPFVPVAYAIAYYYGRRSGSEESLFFVAPRNVKLSIFVSLPFIYETSLACFAVFGSYLPKTTLNF